jgi:hypothetical protein
LIDLQNSTYGNSIWEIGAYGSVYVAPTPTPTPTPTPSPTPAPTPTPTPSSSLYINQTGNLAKNRRVAGSYSASRAIDGIESDDAKRWISAVKDNQWLKVDLGSGYEISKVDILWAGDTTKTYTVQISTNGYKWTDFASGITDGQLTDFNSHTSSGRGRYVRILALSRHNNTYGNSIRELGIYGVPSTISTTTTSSGVVATAASPSTGTVSTTATTTVVKGVAVFQTSEDGIVKSQVVIASSDKVLATVKNKTSVAVETIDLPNGANNLIIRQTDAEGVVSDTPFTVEVNNPTGVWYRFTHKIMSVWRKTISSIKNW